MTPVILNKLASPPRRASAVSRALRALQAEPEESGAWVETAASGDAACGFRVRVAATRALRARAYQLAYRVYRESGFVPEEAEGRVVSAPDADPRTFTLLADDGHDNDLGTISLVFDGPDGLPCDEVFPTDLAPLRARRRRLVEVTRLVMDPSCRGNRTLLTRLFNLISVYARRVARATDFVIEVNPRHAGFYERFLLFHTLGADRSCPRVSGAPARLLRLDLDLQGRVCRESAGGTGKKTRTLYARFMAYDREEAVARALADAHRPMSAIDQRFFGLSSREDGSLTPMLDTACRGHSS